MAVEIANLNGLSHAGAPVMTRGSTSRPTTDAPADDQHQRPDRGQRRAGLPQAAEQRGGVQSSEVDRAG